MLGFKHVGTRYMRLKIMTPLEHAQSMFQKMPPEVFDLWLRPFIEADGWPFSSIYADTRDTAWREYFVGESIGMVAQLTWERKRLPLSISLFNPESVIMINDIIEAHMRDVNKPIAKIKNGKARESFFRSRKFIECTGRVHTPVVVRGELGDFEILDGNHRIAAAFSLGLDESFFLDTWIGHRKANACN